MGRSTAKGMALVSTGLLSLILAGCGSTQAAVRRPQLVTHITYWSGHSSGAPYKAVVAEVRQFNKTHHTIHVTFKAIGALPPWASRV